VASSKRGRGIGDSPVQAEWNRRQAQPGQVSVIPRHEWPGRIVLTIGPVTSSLCVVGLIILWLG
jgi:hypothetical protein